MPYIIEVQKFTNTSPNPARTEKLGMYVHIGYMNKVFLTTKEASDYYDKFNPHMRPLNAHKTLRSDWDPKSYLRYIVREYSGEYGIIPSFSENV
jgi:hypothetical protein